MVLQKGAKLIFGMLPSKVTFELMAHNLHVGDIILFDGDIPHAGSAYHVANIGLHVYLDVPELPRVTDPHKKGSFHIVTDFIGVAPLESTHEVGQEEPARQPPLEGAQKRSRRSADDS